MQDHSNFGYFFVFFVYLCVFCHLSYFVVKLVIIKVHASFWVNTFRQKSWWFTNKLQSQCLVGVQVSLEMTLLQCFILTYGNAHYHSISSLLNHNGIPLVIVVLGQSWSRHSHTLTFSCSHSHYLTTLLSLIHNCIPLVMMFPKMYDNLKVIKVNNVFQYFQQKAKEMCFVFLDKATTEMVKKVGEFLTTQNSPICDPPLYIVITSEPIMLYLNLRQFRTLD